MIRGGKTAKKFTIIRVALFGNKSIVDEQEIQDVVKLSPQTAFN